MADALLPSGRGRAGRGQPHTQTNDAKSDIEHTPVRREVTSTSEWVLELSASGRPFPFLDTSTQIVEEVETGSQGEDRHEVLSTVTENEPDDGYGNVEFTSTESLRGSTSFGFTEVATFFDIREDVWLISLPEFRAVRDVVITGVPETAALRDVTRLTQFIHDSRGLLIGVGRQPFSDEDQSLQQFTVLTRAPSRFHMVSSVDVSGSWQDADGVLQSGTREMLIIYDDDAIFTKSVSQTIDGPNLVTDFKFDPRDGTLLSRVDPSGVAQQFAYDSFGRVIRAVSAAATVTRDYQDATLITGSPIDVPAKMAIATTSQTTGASTIQRIDALGRVVQSVTKGFQGAQVTQEIDYLFGGLVERVSRPHLSGETRQGIIRNDYDDRFRLALRTFPDGTSIEPLYAGRSNLLESAGITFQSGAEIAVSGVRTPKGTTTFAFPDYRGSPVRTVDALANSTRYEYLSFGTLGRITDTEGNITRLTPDLLGRIVSRDDPDTGMSETRYTAFDEVVTFTDGLDGIETPRETRFVYDQTGRLLTMDNDVDGVTMFEYDGLAANNELGRLVETLSPDGHRERYHYETADADPRQNRGFLRSIDRVIDGSGPDGAAGTFTTTLSYDDTTSQLKQVTYPPSGSLEPFAVHYGYDSAGNLTCVDDQVVPSGGCGSGHFWQWQSASQGYRVERETFGNGVHTDYAYEDDTGRLASLVTQRGSEIPIQDIAYTTYDANGNLTGRHQTLKTPAGGLTTTIEAFGYDELDRLTSISPLNSPLPQLVAYEDNGNISSKDGVGAYDYTPLAGERFRPHAVQSISAAGSNTTLRYDDAGNVRERSGTGVKGGTQTFEHTAFNLPKSVTFAQGAVAGIQYEYDASQKRVLTRIDDGDGDAANDQLRIYAGGGYERQTDEGGAVTRHLYKVMAAGRQVAQVQHEVENGDEPVITRRYLHGDHLGSSQVVTDQDGDVVHLQRFDAFGEAVDSESVDDGAKNVRAGFTGHESDVETGLVNMRGRIYDARIGRFLQADPIMQAPFYSQGLNRYSYVFNNPLNAIDPSGFASLDDEIEDPDDRDAEEKGEDPIEDPDDRSADEKDEGELVPASGEVADELGPPDGDSADHEFVQQMLQLAIDGAVYDGNVDQGWETYVSALEQGYNVTPPQELSLGGDDSSTQAQVELVGSEGSAGGGQDSVATEAGDGEGAQADSQAEPNGFQSIFQNTPGGSPAHQDTILQSQLFTHSMGATAAVAATPIVVYVGAVAAPVVVPVLTTGGKVGAAGGALSGAISAALSGQSTEGIVQGTMIGGVTGLVNPFGWVGQLGFYGAPAVAGGLNSLSTNLLNQGAGSLLHDTNPSVEAALLSAAGGALFGGMFANTNAAVLGIPIQGVIIQQSGKGMSGGLLSGASGTLVNF